MCSFLWKVTQTTHDKYSYFWYSAVSIRCCFSTKNSRISTFFIINFSVQIILFFFRILSISFTNRMVFVGKLFLFVKFDYSFQSSETLLVKSLASIYSIMICLKTQMMVLVYNYLVFILKRHYYILLDPAN